MPFSAMTANAEEEYSLRSCSYPESQSPRGFAERLRIQMVQFQQNLNSRLQEAENNQDQRRLVMGIPDVLFM